MRTTPAISLRLRAWAITIRCFKPMRLRRAKTTSVAADIKPRPPISMSPRITACPKPLHWVQVSYSTSPVTQVAEVAVNSAGRNPQDIPLRLAAGSVSSSVPTRIITAKVTAMILVGLRALGLFRCHRESSLECILNLFSPSSKRTRLNIRIDDPYYNNFPLFFNP